MGDAPGIRISTLLLLLTTTLSQKPEGTRYIVKYKSGSKKYQEKLANAAREPYPSKDELDESNAFLTYGRFLPKANAEVVYFSTEVDMKEYEKMDDVEFIEQGMC